MAVDLDALRAIIAARAEALQDPNKEELEAAWEAWCKYDDEHRDQTTATPLSDYSGRRALEVVLVDFLEKRRG